MDEIKWRLKKLSGEMELEWLEKMKKTIKANIKSVYRKYAKEFDEKIASLEIYNASYDYLLEKIQDGAAVLDLACGPGNVSFYLKQYKPDLRITGVDISEEMIELAKARIKDGAFILKDICEIGFDTKFDCVICAFGIPYLDLEATAHVMQTIKKSLKPNGHYYISYIEGTGKGYAQQSFTHNDELFIFSHPEEDVLGILDQQALSVIKRFAIDYHEQDGTITNEIIYIGNKR